VLWGRNTPHSSTLRKTTVHKHKQVVVADQNHWILFIARVLHNRPLTTGFVSFDNKKGVNVRSRTVDNQKVSIFFCAEELERPWRWQCEIERASNSMESARPEDVFVFGDLVAEESGTPKFTHDPFFVICAKQEINKRLRELGLLSFMQLQGLTAMLYPADEQIAA